MQKMSLVAAGKLLGVTANAVRARAKKNPELYRVERDNEGKIWVYLDIEDEAHLKVSTSQALGKAGKALEGSVRGQIVALERSLAASVALKDAASAARDDAVSRAEALAARIATLQAQTVAAEAARVDALQERDHWRDLAMALAQKPARRWWFW